MFKKFNIMLLVLSMGIAVAEELTENQQQMIQQQTLEEFAKIIFQNAMEAKRAFQQPNVRESVIDNFATTAPRSEFVVNADISEELASGVISSSIYVSTDNQNSWQSSDANLMGTEGYENTWEATINTGGGNTAHAYLSGVINSEALGESYGEMLVSGSPHNVNSNFPPPGNLYAVLANDESGDASSSYDITQVRGTYKGTDAVDSEGNTYTDIDRIYLDLALNGNCCDEGSFFGPWYLYGLGIVNPESEDAVAYAIGYGDGGFGQLTPGLLKITGDLATGDIDSFEYLTTNIEYTTAGNNLQATVLMDLITQDSQWGTWPNSYNGFIVVGVTVEAGLDGLDVAADIKDQTDPGLFVCQTTFQEGNTPLVLSNPDFNDNVLSVQYADADGNLPWYKAGQICNTPANGGNCFAQVSMIPDSHDYENGVIFSADINTLIEENSLSGDYEAHFWFADDDIDEYPSAQIEMNITVSGSGCGLIGDSNGDGSLNVLDVVLLVNLILDANASGDDCSDVNGDGALNVLDVVLLVNLILGT